MLLILAIALVVLGPEKLPQIARVIGRGLGEVPPCDRGGAGGDREGG
ncbi:MAG: twin-arginine translocase TatA/TatE family subunit [Candidatus Manganitrophus sp.]|nr:twin-arginine translocase TatA/TatE family subunit [Candidatus Manganitrophus sp.]